MAYETVHSFRARNNSKKAPIMMAFSNGKDQSISILFSEDIMKRMRLEVGERVDLLEGNEEDIGFIKIVKCSENKGYRVMKWNRATNEGYIKIASNRLRHSTPPSHSVSIEGATFQLFGGELVVALPDWMARKSA